MLLAKTGFHFREVRAASDNVCAVAELTTRP
jgi:hypothetical protein